PRSPRLPLSMRSGYDVLRPRHVLRECADQEYPLRAEHHVTRRLDLCVCGGLCQPGVFPIGGICSCRALATLQRPGEVWIADLGIAAKTRPVMILSTPLPSLKTSFSRLHLDQILDIFLPVERRKVVDVFASADKTRWNSKFILDRVDDSAFAAAIEFRDNQAGESNRVVEFAGLTECVTAGGRIDDQQRFLRGVRNEFAERAFHFLQLGHEVRFGMLATSSVTKQPVDFVLHCRLVRFVTKCGWIGAVLPANHLNAKPFGPNA